MDELSLLAGARPVEPPEPAVVAAARERLIVLALQEGRPAPAGPVQGRRRRPRRTWQIAWGAGLAAAATAAVAAGVFTGVPAGPSGGTANPGPASAADLLRRASLMAVTDQLAPRADQLIHVTMAETAMSGGGPASAPAAGGPPRAASGAAWLQPTRWQGWESAASDRPGLIRISYGSPQPLPGGTLSAQARQPADAEWRTAACTGSFTAPTYAFLSTLPTQPQQLATQVDAEVRRTLAAGDLADATRRVEETWEVLAGLARAPMVPPKLQAAVYQLMSEQPDVRLIGAAVDAAGRPGVAVSRTLSGQGVRSELIFAADSYRYLGEREVTTGANPSMGLPGNVTIDARAVLAVEVVDAAPAPGAHAQTADCGPNRLTD
jgi:hypothetical protein